jgi:hypothetical protein
MKTFAFVVVLLLVAIAGFGMYRGWFHVSTNNAGEQPSATITVDKNKLRADEQKAKDKVESLGQEAKDKVGGPADKAKQPEYQR